MKLFVAGVASAVISSVITLVVVKYFFTDKPELVYSLSSPIYTSLMETDNRESMQQLTIKNNGNKKAERIIVALSTFVKDYEIKKYVSTDSIYAQNNRSKFEMIYPSLPPDGEIEILFKINHTIANSQVTVKHDDGLATDAFSKTKNGSKFYTIVNLIIAMILLSQFLFVAFLKALGYHTINLKIGTPPKEENI